MHATRTRLLPGPAVCGFWGLFDADYGDPSTPRPYPRVTPSALGGVTLPFRCPHCKRIRADFADGAEREKYHDARDGHGNYWCPDCGGRFDLALPGAPLAAALPAGSVVAPSRVERAGRLEVQDAPGAWAFVRRLLNPQAHRLGVDALGG